MLKGSYMYKMYIYSVFWFYTNYAVQFEAYEYICILSTHFFHNIAHFNEYKHLFNDNYGDNLE